MVSGTLLGAEVVIVTDWMKWLGQSVWRFIRMLPWCQKDFRTDEDKDYWYRTLSVGVLVVSLSLAVAVIQASPKEFSAVVGQAYSYTGADKALVQAFTLAVLILLFALPMVLAGLVLFALLAGALTLLWAILLWGIRKVFGTLDPVLAPSNAPRKARSR